MKLALYRNTTYRHSGSFPSMFCDEDDDNSHGSEYARVSEPVEVEFPPLSTEAVIKQQIDALDRTEQQIREDFQQKLDAIQNRRAELQALTYVPA